MRSSYSAFDVLPKFKTNFGQSPEDTSSSMLSPPDDYQKLGQLLATIEDHYQLDRQLRKIHTATAKGKITSTEALSILEAGFDAYQRFQDALARNVMRVGYLWALVEKEPQNQKAVQGLAEEQVKCARAFDSDHTELLRAAHQRPKCLGPDMQEYFDRSVRQALGLPSPRAVRGEKTILEDELVKLQEDLQLKPRDHRIISGIARNRFKLSLLNGNSHSQAAASLIKEIPPVIERTLFPVYLQGAIDTAGPQSPASALLELEKGSILLKIDPTNINSAAAPMSVALARVSKSLPQDIPTLSRVVSKIDELARRYMNNERAADNDNVFAIYETVIADITKTRKDSLLQLLLELSLTTQKLRHYPSSEEEAQRLGFLHIHLARHKRCSVAEVLEMVQDYLKLEKRGFKSIPESQKEHYLIGAIYATPEGSPERALLLNEMDKFDAKRNVEHPRKRKLQKQAKNIRLSKKLMSQRPETFSSAFKAFLENRPGRRVRHPGTPPPSMPGLEP